MTGNAVSRADLNEQVRAHAPQLMQAAIGAYQGGKRAEAVAICRRIARLHGGEIAAVARPHGAEFILRLPC